MSNGHTRMRCAPAACTRGTGLVELLVALTLGAIAVAGAAAVYVSARDVLSALETNARLQETARYALAIIETDLRNAGYVGLAGPTIPVTVSVPLHFPAKCGGASWVTETSRFVDGADDSYLSLGACAAAGGGHRAGSDVLLVRRASVERIIPQSGVIAAPYRDRVLVASSPVAAQLFVPQDAGNALPPGFATADVPGQPPYADTREFLVNAYYVSVNSSIGTGYPALRRKSLVAGPDIRDEEVVPGVEDLQFRLGVDTDGDAGADIFVDPGRVPAGARPVSARVWLRLRARERDPSYLDDLPANYAGRTVAATGDSFRRLLVSKTVQLRNARP